MNHNYKIKLSNHETNMGKSCKSDNIRPNIPGRLKFLGNRSDSWP